ncbi:Glycerol 2-dehydrogenase [Meyerozyma sp. JA9]|nr:Glycerol 2-dehydrogenase [Meyerozyma sp. JA9]
MPAQNTTSILKFYTGQEIPALGLGTWQSNEEQVYNAVLAALKAGYRHIDTAACYGNEKPIGDAIKASGIPRNELFITTKLWSTDHTRVASGIAESLKKLDTDYVDLYLMHWPVPLNPNGNHALFPKFADGSRDILQTWDFVKTYNLMQSLVENKQARAIGVSNFTVKNLKTLLEAPTTKIKPVANQVEMHPYLPQPKLLEFCRQNEILIQSYSPLGSTDSPLLEDDVVVKIAGKYGVAPATILTSWAIWRGTVVLPKSVTPTRIESNFKTVKLEDVDGEELNQLHKIRGVLRLVSPDWAPFVVFDSNE